MEYPRYIGSYGLLVKNQQVLLVGNDFGDGQLRWGLPGGNLERGEAAEQAVVREVLEETGLHVRVRRLRYITEHVGTRNYWLTFTYEVDLAAPDPLTGGGSPASLSPAGDQDPDGIIKGVRWVPLVELPGLLPAPWFLQPLQKACREPEAPVWHEVWRHD